MCCQTAKAIELPSTWHATKSVITGQPACNLCTERWCGDAWECANTQPFYCYDQPGNL